MTSHPNHEYISTKEASPVSDLFVAGVGVHLSPVETAEEAIAAGRYDPESAASDQVLSVCVEPERYPAEMAVLAAREAVAMAQAEPDSFRAVFHTYVDYQGARYWQAGPYVAQNAIGPAVPSFDVVQECNGQMGAMELGRRFVTGPDDRVLVTTADRFDHPWVSRWYADQSVLGDGGAAVVLSGAGGFARVASLVTMAENSLEGEARGSGFHSGSDLSTVDFDQLRKEFHDDVPLLEHYARMETLIHSGVERALSDAGITRSELTWAIPAMTTKWRVEITLDRFLGLPLERSTWELGRRTGHIGGGDQIVGLHHLVTTGALHPGDRVLLLGGGTGYTLTVAVLEITDAVA